MTNDFERRWKQHTGILQGGAKYTKKFNDWTPICIIDGFPSKKEAMQCEWRVKRAKGYKNRVKQVANLISSSQRWTKQSPMIKDQLLNIYVSNDYHSYFSIPIKEIVWY
tara:strand:- start:33 stop:359 length:327 start_codon:yes stop_codon:yes gene_type:complete